MKVKLSIFIIALLILLQSFSSPFIVLAKNNNNLKSDKYESILLSEMSHKTKLLNDNVERYLNKKGVLDSDIECIDKHFLNNINNSNINNIMVKVEYIHYKYNSSNNKIIQKTLNRNEVNNLIDKLFYRTNHTGAITQNNTTTITDSYLKKTLIVAPVKIKNKKKLSVSYNCEWLTQPTERMIDIATISWGQNQGSFDPNEYFSAYYFTERTDDSWHMDLYGEWHHNIGKELLTYNISNNMRANAKETGLSAKFRLKNTEWNYYPRPFGTYSYYKKHKVNMNFYITNLNGKYTYFNGQYYHQYVNEGFSINSIDVSFSWNGTPSISISGGYNSSKYYKKLGKNLLLNYYR